RAGRDRGQSLAGHALGRAGPRRPSGFRQPRPTGARVQFTYTPVQLALRERAGRLTEAIIPYEEPCEAGRGLPDRSLAEIRDLVSEHRLNAINMPTEWGGQGLSVL